MKEIRYDLKTKELKIIEVPEPTPEEIAEMEKRFEEERKASYMPSDVERIEAIETAILELAEVLANG